MSIRNRTRIAGFIGGFSTGSALFPEGNYGWRFFFFVIAIVSFSVMIHLMKTEWGQIKRQNENHLNA